MSWVVLAKPTPRSRGGAVATVAVRDLRKSRRAGGKTQRYVFLRVTEKLYDATGWDARSLVVEAGNAENAGYVRLRPPATAADEANAFVLQGGVRTCHSRYVVVPASLLGMEHQCSLAREVPHQLIGGALVLWIGKATDARYTVRVDAPMRESVEYKRYRDDDRAVAADAGRVHPAQSLGRRGGSA